MDVEAVQSWVETSTSQGVSLQSVFLLVYRSPVMAMFSIAKYIDSLLYFLQLLIPMLSQRGVWLKHTLMNDLLG